MIILYYCRDGENEELRYSLRSMAKHMNYPVIIVGGKPDWCHPDVFLERKQEGWKAQAAINNLVLGLEWITSNKEQLQTITQRANEKERLFVLSQSEAPKVSGTEGDVSLNDACVSAGVRQASDIDTIIMMDDIYLTQPFLKNRIREGLDEQIAHLQKIGNSGYERTLSFTNNWCKSRGIEPKGYNCHTPFLCNAEDLLAVCKSLGGERVNMSYRIVYGSTHETPHAMHPDQKFLRPIKDDSEFMVREVFSTNDMSFKSVQKHLDKLFPTPCRHEFSMAQLAIRNKS